MSLAKQPAPGCRSLYSTRVDVGEQMETLIGRSQDARGTLTGRPGDVQRKLTRRPGPGGPVMTTDRDQRPFRYHRQHSAVTLTGRDRACLPAELRGRDTSSANTAAGKVGCPDCYLTGPWESLITKNVAVQGRRPPFLLGSVRRRARRTGAGRFSWPTVRVPAVIYSPEEFYQRAAPLPGLVGRSSEIGHGQGGAEGHSVSDSVSLAGLRRHVSLSCQSVA